MATAVSFDQRHALLGLVFAIVASTPPGSAAAAVQPFAPADLLAVRAVSDPHVSPDGAWVAYVVRTNDLEADRATSDLWMVRWDGAPTLQLTYTEEASESTPRFSPDNRYLAVLAARGGEDAKDQVWLLDRAGGEARRLTDLPGGVSEYAWSPDGKRMALVASDPDPEDIPAPDGDVGKADKQKTPAPLVIDRSQFKQDAPGTCGTRGSTSTCSTSRARRPSS